LIEFVIEDGPIDFALADQFDITVTQMTWTFGTDEWVTNRWNPPVEIDLANTNLDFPNDAFDGNASTNCFKIGQTTGILTWFFEDATAFDQYGIRARGTSFDATEAPFNWTLEWSDDGGTNWTVEDTQAAEVFTAGELKTYVLSTGRHLYWRLNITANNGGTDIEFAQVTMRKTGQTLDTPSERSLLMQGQGLAGTDEIYMGWQLEEDALSPFYNWAIYGMSNYEALDPIEAQPGVNPSAPKWVCDTNQMELFLNATGRFIAATSKIATDYTNCHIGLLLPYSQPAEYSYPLIIMGGSGINRHYTSTDIRHRQCYDPGEDAAYVRNPGGSWKLVENFSSSQVTDRVVWPYGTASTIWRQLQDNITEALGGEYEVWPLVVAEFDEDGSGEDPLLDQIIYGEIDGAYWISGSNNSAENPVTIGPDTYICFQNVFRTTFVDFYAILEQP
jgi:hypothetical protein